MKLINKIYTGLVFAFLYAPIIVMVVFSFNNSRSRTVWKGFTLNWYRELFRDDEILNSLYLTLIVAALASIIATVIGTLAAIGFNSMNKRMRSALMTINNIPMVNPEIVTGVSLMLLFVFVFKMTGLLQPGFATLLLAHITFNIPYVILSVLPKLRQMNASLYEAALDLGCPPLQAFFKVVLPEISSGIITGMMMAFTMSLDDFVISYFTSGSTAQTLSMTIYSMTKKRVSPKINALSTLLFVTVLILLILVNVRQNREESKYKKGLK